MSTDTFNKGGLMVKENLFRTPRRSYRISDIEKVTIKRPMFWMITPLAIGSFLLLSEYSAYLYQIETYICMAMFTVVPLIFWNIGTLSITSKSYANDDAVTGFMPTLKQARYALEESIIEQSDKSKEVKNG